MSMISTKARNVKPTRRTARPFAPFGAGLVHYVPFAVAAADFVEPSDEDKAAAAALFSADADWSARMAADANGDHCEACGRPVERGELEGGLCNVCQCRAEEATIASLYGSVGMGFRSY
jgi:hypothetical protein